MIMPLRHNILLLPVLVILYERLVYTDVNRGLTLFYFGSVTSHAALAAELK